MEERVTMTLIGTFTLSEFEGFKVEETLLLIVIVGYFIIYTKCK